MISIIIFFKRLKSTISQRVSSYILIRIFEDIILVSENLLYLDSVTAEAYRIEQFQPHNGLVWWLEYISIPVAGIKQHPSSRIPHVTTQC